MISKNAAKVNKQNNPIDRNQKTSNYTANDQGSQQSAQTNKLKLKLLKIQPMKVQSVKLSNRESNNQSAIQQQLQQESPSSEQQVNMHVKLINNQQQKQMMSDQNSQKIQNSNQNNKFNKKQRYVAQNSNQPAQPSNNNYNIINSAQKSSNNKIVVKNLKQIQTQENTKVNSNSDSKSIIVKNQNSQQESQNQNQSINYEQKLHAEQTIMQAQAQSKQAINSNGISFVQQLKIQKRNELAQNGKKQGDDQFDCQRDAIADAQNNFAREESKQQSEYQGTNTHVGQESIALNIKSQSSSFNFNPNYLRNQNNVQQQVHSSYNVANFQAIQKGVQNTASQSLSNFKQLSQPNYYNNQQQKSSIQKESREEQNKNEKYQHENLQKLTEQHYYDQKDRKKSTSKQKKMLSDLNMVFESDEILTNSFDHNIQKNQKLPSQLYDSNSQYFSQVNQDMTQQQYDSHSQFQSKMAATENFQIQNKNQSKLSVQRSKSLKQKKKKAVKISKEDFYQNERRNRPIYQDQELHQLIVALILCLFLQPQRGTLDDLYCHQYPINNDKKNYLFMMHQHLSHPANSQIIQSLVKEMQDISPPLAGQRLLKLMCPQLFDLSLYNNGKDWRKLAVGAYGTVYECKTNLIHPSSVAIKQMDLPNDIYDRCVLHDIFTEITCLEEFRLEKCVTDLYDYGVDKQSYYIVMKKYTCSLGEWRRNQGNNIEVFQQNLGLYVSIYNQILKSLRKIHSNNVTHYDIKCDNVLISFIGDEPSYNNQETNRDANSLIPKDRDLRNMTEDDFEITIGDFGECKIFSNDKDEFCTRNRGTDSIKSPEMLQLTINTRKDHDKYDRRKQVGTNRLSDIWSVGCLFYELLTGEFLLYDPDWAYFFVRVVSHTQELIPKDKLDKIDNNQYIKDFLKFILIRDQRLRPTIDKVIKRFEHIHAILCNVGSSSQINIHTSNIYGFQQYQPYPHIKSNQELNDCLKSSSEIYSKDVEVQFYKNKSQNLLTRITEQIFICTSDYFQGKENIGTAIQNGITHIVGSEIKYGSNLSDKFEIIRLDKKQTSLKVIGIVMDFLRKAILYKGRILFVENKEDNLMKECILIALNHIFKTSAYETYALIKSQNLFFSIDGNRLSRISNLMIQAFKIRLYLASFPQFSCHCGSSLIILDRAFSQYQNKPIVACNCPQKITMCNYINNQQDLQMFNASPQNNFKTCPCASNPYVGCQEYLDFLNKYYQANKSLSKTHIQHNNQLIWGYCDPSDFILGPNPNGVPLSDESLNQNQNTLDSKRSQGSSKRSLKTSNKVPKIPLAQVAQRNNQKWGTAMGMRSIASMQLGSSDRQKENLTNRLGISQSNIIERMISSNFSQTVDINSIQIIDKNKFDNFQDYTYNGQQIIPNATAGSANNIPTVGPVPPLQINISKRAGLPSSASLLNNYEQTLNQKGAVNINPQQKQENFWNIRKCRVCNCWTYAYNQQLNKFAVLLNNRIHFNSQGMLTHHTNQGISNSNLEELERNFVLMGEELLRKYSQSGIQNGRIARNSFGGQPIINNYNGQSNQQNIHNLGGIVRGAVGHHMAQGGVVPDQFIQYQGSDLQNLPRGGDKQHQQMSTVDKMNLSLSQGFTMGGIDRHYDGVKVPILRDISIQLPF